MRMSLPRAPRPLQTQEPIVSVMGSMRYGPAAKLLRRRLPPRNPGRIGRSDEALSLRQFRTEQPPVPQYVRSDGRSALFSAPRHHHDGAEQPAPGFYSSGRVYAGAGQPDYTGSVSAEPPLHSGQKRPYRSPEMGV